LADQGKRGLVKKERKMRQSSQLFQKENLGEVVTGGARKLYQARNIQVGEKKGISTWQWGGGVHQIGKKVDDEETEM